MPAFDTHKAVKELCHAGFDNAQAEAVVDQISGAIHENVATRTDIETLGTKLNNAVLRLEGEIEKLELRLTGEIEKQATKYLRSIVVVAAAIVGVTKALDLLVG